MLEEKEHSQNISKAYCFADTVIDRRLQQHIN